MEKYEQKSEESDDFISQEDDLSYRSVMSDQEENFVLTGEPLIEQREEEKGLGRKLLIRPDQSRAGMSRNKEENYQSYELRRRGCKYQIKNEQPIDSNLMETSLRDDKMKSEYQNQARKGNGKWKKKKEQITHIRKERKLDELSSLSFVEPALIKSVTELKLTPIKNEWKKPTIKYIKKIKQNEEEKIKEPATTERSKQKVEYNRKKQQQSNKWNYGENRALNRKKEVPTPSNPKLLLNVDALPFTSHRVQETGAERDFKKLSTEALPFKPKKKINAPAEKFITTPVMYHNIMMQSESSPIQMAGVPFYLPSTSNLSINMISGYSLNYSAFPYQLA